MDQDAASEASPTIRLNDVLGVTDRPAGVPAARRSSSSPEYSLMETVLAVLRAARTSATEAAKAQAADRRHPRPIEIHGAVAALECTFLAAPSAVRGAQRISNRARSRTVERMRTGTVQARHRRGWFWVLHGPGRGCDTGTVTYPVRAPPASRTVGGLTRRSQPGTALPGGFEHPPGARSPALVRDLRRARDRGRGVGETGPPLEPPGGVIGGSGGGADRVGYRVGGRTGPVEAARPESGRRSAPVPRGWPPRPG